MLQSNITFFISYFYFIDRCVGGFKSQAGQRILVNFVLVLHLLNDFVIRMPKKSIKFHIKNTSNLPVIYQYCLYPNLPKIVITYG